MLISLADGPRARHGTGLEIYWPPSTGQHQAGCPSNIYRVSVEWSQPFWLVAGDLLQEKWVS